MMSLKEETKTKALLVISKYLPEYTGAAYRIHNLHRRLQEKGVSMDFEVLCTSTSQKTSALYNHEGFSVKRIVFPWSLSWLPTRLSNAIKVYYEAFFSYLYIARKKPEFLHIAGYSGATMAALLYGRIKNIPRLVELVTRDASPFQYLPGLRYPKFLRLDRKTIIIAISDAIAETVRKKGLDKNIWSRPNPIDEKRFSLVSEKDKQVIRKKISPFLENDIIICMVAKFMPQKNQIFLLDVLKELPPKYKLLLAGPLVEEGMFYSRDNDYFGEIKSKIQCYAISERVHINVGFVDASQYIKASDIYVMPQYSEGLGTPMLEAMACAVPVVANDNERAFRQWVEDGVNGFLSDLDAAEFAEKIKGCSSLSKECLNNFAARILAMNSNEKLDNQYMKIFEVLNSASGNKEMDIRNVI